VLDGRGTALGTTTVQLAPLTPDAPAPKVRDTIRTIGPTAPPWSVAIPIDYTLWTPTAQNQITTQVMVDSQQSGVYASARARASGQLGIVGLEGSLAWDGSPATPTGDGWVGARVRALRLGNASLELGPSLRFGFPLGNQGAPARIEPGFAVGGTFDHFSWVADLGGRFRLSADTANSGAPPILAYAFIGGFAHVGSLVRLGMIFDGAVMSYDAPTTPFQRVPESVRGGFAIGAEFGKEVFGSTWVHLHSLGTSGDLGPASLQLGIGLRELP
jgi:hypothetical protein